MKNKMVKALSIMMSLCMLGGSGVQAAEFSSGTETVNEVPETSETVEFAEDTTEADDTADVFNAQEDAEPFSDAETPDEFSADEEVDEIPEAQDPGSIDSTLAARYKNAVVEAELEADPNVKTTCKVYNGSNLENQDYSTFGSCIDSYECTSPDGGIMRVQFGAVDGKTLVEYYDTDYNIQKTVTVPLALPKYGAFYESGNYYYILTGQDNPDNNDAVEVYRVTKYSKDWKVQGSASLYGENTKKAFDFGSARMTMNGNILYVRTCHVMYGGHQANVTFSVNTDNMTVVDKKTDISNASTGYVSHSFNQFIQIDQGKMTALDQCDAFPSRALVMLKYSADLSEGKFVPDFNYVSSEEMERRKCAQTDIMKVGGNVGDNYTGTSAGGFEYSDSCWLVAGNFDTDGAGSSRNAFIAAVPKNGGDPVVRYFTNYGGTDDSASTPHLVKTGSNSFILLWSSQGKVYYTAVDGNGQQSGQTYSMDGNLSGCQPTVINGKLCWYTWKNNVNVFYEINLSDLSGTRAVKIVNGHKFSYGKEVTNGTVTRTCTVCGENQDNVAVPTSMEPVYTKANGHLAYLRGNIELDPGTYQMVCGPCFTASGDRLSDCQVTSSDPDVVSVKMLGSTDAQITVHKSGSAVLTIQSKYNPDAVETANISVGILDSSHYDMSVSEESFVYDGTEHRPVVKLYKKGLAQEVSTDNYTVEYEGDLVNAGTVNVSVKGTGTLAGSISKEFVIKPAELSGCQVTVSEKPVSFVKGKKSVTEYTVKDGDRTLTEGKDFTVSYKNNDRPGTAQIIFSGTGNYQGEVRKSFTIVREEKEDKNNTENKNNTGDKNNTENKDNTGDKNNTENKDNTGDKNNTENKDNTGDKNNTENKDNTGDKNNTENKDNTGDKNNTENKDNTGDKNDTENKGDDENKKDNVENKDNTNNKEDSEEKDNTDKKDDTNKKDDTENKDNTNGKDDVNKKDDTATHTMDECTIQVAAEKLIYNGTAQTPGVTITYEGKALTEGQDYTLSYEKNTDAGMANVVIQGKGIYTGEAYKTFEIARADASVSVSSKTVTMGKKKLALADWMTTDGKVTYKSSDSKTVKISGNQYIALKPGKAVITISAKQGQNYNALPATKVTITVRPLNTTGVNLKPGRKGQVKVSWKSVKSISGYQIQYSTSANMKKAKSVMAKSSAKNVILKKLSSKKNCYVRIRTYKTVKGKKYYSGWSTVKNVKTR
ncbi:MAG: hypothetical protein ACLURP_06560 [Ruminococcus sp.]